VPYQDLPWTLNPQDGVIVAANQAVSASSTPYLGSGLPVDPDRRAHRQGGSVERRRHGRASAGLR